jgi:hypothetical protein
MVQQKFRYEVVDSVLEAYKKIKEAESVSAIYPEQEL